MSLAVLLAALALQSPPGTAPAPPELGLRRYTLDLGASRIGFRASSSVVEFTGTATRFGAELRADPERLAATAAGEVWIETSALSTDNDERDDQMRAKLLSREHARITFRLDALEAPPAEGQRWTARGRFTIAGVERGRVFPVAVERRGDGFSVRGELRFPMSEHGIEPPRWLLVTVEDEVAVSFDLTLAPLAAETLPARVRLLEVREVLETPGGVSEASERRERLWSSGLLLLWERPDRALWHMHDGERAATIDARAASERAPAPTAEERFAELAAEIVALRADPSDQARERLAALEGLLALAPPQGEVEVVTTADSVSLWLGGREWVRAEGLEGHQPIGELLGCLEGLPNAVAAGAAELCGIPHHLTVRTVTPEGARTLQILVGEPVDAALPGWVQDPGSLLGAGRVPRAAAPDPEQL